MAFMTRDSVGLGDGGDFLVTKKSHSLALRICVPGNLCSSWLTINHWGGRGAIHWGGCGAIGVLVGDRGVAIV
jgi:hypothetical protein